MNKILRLKTKQGPWGRGSVIQRRAHGGGEAGEDPAAEQMGKPGPSRRIHMEPDGSYGFSTLLTQLNLKQAKMLRQVWLPKTMLYDENLENELKIYVGDIVERSFL